MKDVFNFVTHAHYDFALFPTNETWTETDFDDADVILLFIFLHAKAYLLIHLPIHEQTEYEQEAFEPSDVGNAEGDRYMRYAISLYLI